MRYRIKYGAILVLIIMFSTMLSIHSPLVLASQEVSIGSTNNNDITVFIRGLEVGDEAILWISFEGKMSVDEAIMSKTLTGTGKEISVSLPVNLKKRVISA